MRQVDVIPYFSCQSNNDPKVTCGILFNKCLNHFTSMLSDDPILLFASGMAVGQAEKIFLGACQAAMFRPSPENQAKMLSVCVYLSGVYGLEVSVFQREEIANEIWLHNGKCVDLLSRTLTTEEVNSPIWHTVRGVLCGVPFNQVDLDFHKRRGYREVCDEVSHG